MHCRGHDLDSRQRPSRKKGLESRVLGFGDLGKGTRRVSGRELVLLSCRGSSGNERIVLDAEFGEGGVNGTGRNDADRAAAMLRRLLDDHSDTLQPGLRGFVYDMAMTSKTIDQVLDMGVLPITKVPRSPGGGHQSVNLGTLPFTGADGTQHDHAAVTVNGAPSVVLPDSDGTKSSSRCAASKSGGRTTGRDTTSSPTATTRCRTPRQSPHT